MRGHPLRVLTLCAAGLVALAARPGVAEEAQARLRIAPPPTLTAGTPVLIEVFAKLPPGPEQPVLLTPRSEGEAVRVTRGRLLRADAHRTESGELRFQVPVVLSGAGTAVLHVELLTYRCAKRCEAVRASASKVLQVMAR